MKNAEMKVVRFDARDVIATSTFSGIFDNITGNATMDYGGKIYTSENIADLYSQLGINKDSKVVASKLNPGSDDYKSLGWLFNSSDSSKNTGGDYAGNASATKKAWYNSGTFEWVNGKFIKQ